MKNVNARASAESFILNGLSIRQAMPASVFHDLLGTPDRIIAAGSPAPDGHRNNHIHIYDHLGIYINEHHYTYLLSSVTFVLSPEFSSFQPTNPFSGTLEIGSLSITSPFPESEIVHSELNFQCRLSGTWTLEGNPTNWINLDSKRKIVHSASVGLPHDPHDDTCRP